MADPIIAGYPQSESECGKQMISGVAAADSPSSGRLFLPTQAGALS